VSLTHTTGYKILPDVLDQTTIERLKHALESAGDASQRGESVYARRNILSLPDVQAVAADPRVLALTSVATIPTRAIFFDKVPGANWHVGCTRIGPSRLRSAKSFPVGALGRLKQACSMSCPPPRF
jgi:hypothetical protein